MPVTTYYEWNERYEENLPADLRTLLHAANKAIERPKGHIAIRRHIHQEPRRKYVLFGERIPEVWHYQVLIYTGAGIEYNLVADIGCSEGDAMAYLAGIVDGAWQLKRRIHDEQTG